MVGTMSDALGGFGPGPRVSVDGTDYHFIFDVPKMVAEMEQLCLQWRRGQLDLKLESLGPTRHIPGTFEATKAQELWSAYEADLENGSLLPNGEQFEKWKKSKDGRLAPLLAALRVTRPDADPKLIEKIALKKPNEIQAILVELGNVIGEFGTRHLDSLKRINPEKAAEVEARIAASRELLRKATAGEALPT